MEQFQSYKLDMGCFGHAKALNEDILGYLTGYRLLVEYGLRCISDFKSFEFVEKNYEKVLRMEYALGKIYNFIGLARYKLKFFKKE